MFKKSLLYFILFFVAAITTVKAQDNGKTSPYINYTDDVLRYSLEYPAYDPISLVMPAVSQPTGFGTFQVNPASAALFQESFFSFDLSSRFVNETGDYLQNSSDNTDNQTRIGDIGFVYKLPTIRGSLVIGGGYSQTTDFNRALSAGGFNSKSTITDFYANLPKNDSLNVAAYNAFAVEDVNADSSVSILRNGLNYSDYRGINQDIEFTERGQLGEYSAFIATEFAKNLSVGASIGFLSGTYSYRRDFLESDQRNNYNGEIIPAGDNGEYTDIDRILSHDKIDTDIQAFSARLGLVYEPTDNFSFGASYEFPSKLSVDEDYNTEIITTFDNGLDTGIQDAPYRYSYKIKRPSRFKVGLTAKRENGLTFSASAEAVRYSQGQIEFHELRYRSDEDDINSVIKSELTDVINIRAGLQYTINRYFTPRIGYAYFPSPKDDFDSARQFLSGGFSAEITPGLLLDFGLQYSFWEDQNALYQTPRVSEVVKEDASKFNMMIGLRMAI